ncbi:hypothetical protein BGZ83_011120 [Gryganskiella cystojenkinii]|nr:hypothetical protein BGZ83_011120 [Gryganskiella cystojenkinii]
MYLRVQYTFRAAFGLAFGNLLLAADCQQLQAIELLFNVATSGDTEAEILAYAEALSPINLTTTVPYMSPSDVVLELLNKNTSMNELLITGNFEDMVGPEQQDPTSAVPTTNLLSLIKSDHLEFLSIKYQKVGQSHYEKSWNEVASHLPRLHHLEVLNFTGSEASLMDFVTRCPNLVALKVRRDFCYDPMINNQVIWNSNKALRHIGITLKALKQLEWAVDDEGDECKEMLEDVFLINPGQLTKINIRAPRVSYSTFAQKALLDIAASIRELTLDGVAMVWSDDIQQFMQRATNLKLFKIQTLSRPYDKAVDLPLFYWHLYDPEGNNDDKRPWACEQTLERLAVVIQVSIRARLDVNVNPKPIMTEGEKYAHKTVYSQLSRLTNLRELVLSGQSRNDHRDLDKMHTECLALSLESGLDMLHGMNEMEVLDVRNCAHRIGVKELEWIHDHWPKLKTIKGLTESRAWADKEAEKELVKVKQWKAEHPRGIGSLFD